jgi:cytochrome c-type biogenesis protein CcmH
LRIIVRERITAGDNDEQVLSYMTSRYGDWVLLKPPFDGATIILWMSPLFLLLIGFFVIFKNQGNRQETPNSAPLSADEKKRLKNLLKDKGGK